MLFRSEEINRTAQSINTLRDFGGAPVGTPTMLSHKYLLNIEMVKYRRLTKQAAKEMAVLNTKTKIQLALSTAVKNAYVAIVVAIAAASTALISFFTRSEAGHNKMRQNMSYFKGWWAGIGDDLTN